MIRWLARAAKARPSLRHRQRLVRPKRAEKRLGCFVFHNAGLAGNGNSSYIDSVILRDKDANTAWTAASDATLEERRYYVQNWRADVVALLTAGGAVSEWVRYSAYGEATVYPFVNGDYNGDGGVDGDDVIAFEADVDSAAAAADVDRDGGVDGDDTTAFYASYNNGWMSTAWTAAGGLPSTYEASFNQARCNSHVNWNDIVAACTPAQGPGFPVPDPPPAPR